jgi:hypothetical protein
MQIMCLPAPAGGGEGTIQTKPNNLKFPLQRQQNFGQDFAFLDHCGSSTNQTDNGTAANEETKILPGQVRRRLGLPLTPLTKNSPPENEKRTERTLPAARTGGERVRCPLFPAWIPNLSVLRVLLFLRGG